VQRSSDPSDNPKAPLPKFQTPPTGKPRKWGGWLNPTFKIKQKDEDTKMNESLFISFEGHLMP
jgi:hypothetical protein